MVEEGTPGPLAEIGHHPQVALGTKLWFSVQVLSSSISTGSEVGHILH